MSDYTNLIGCSISFGDKVVNFPYKYGINTIGVFQDVWWKDPYSRPVPAIDINYSSSDINIATINSEGVIEPILSGVCLIKVVIRDKPEIEASIYCQVINGVPIGLPIGLLGLTYS